MARFGLEFRKKIRKVLLGSDVWGTCWGISKLNGISEDLRWEGTWLLSPGGDQEFLEVVQILSCSFSSLLTSCGVQKRISLIFFIYSDTSKYLHIHCPPLKKWNGNILYSPFGTFPFPLSSTFWRWRDYPMSAHITLPQVLT